MIRRFVSRIVHRCETAGDLLTFVARRRPWLLPVLLGLLGLSGLVALAQAAQISPFIYTLF